MERQCSLNTTLALGLMVALLAGLAAHPGSAASMARGAEPEANTELLAPVGTAFTYQGRLEKDGVPVDGTCNLQFSLWDALSGGSQVDPPQTRTNVQLREGLFTVADLDFGGGAFTGEARWLEVAVQCSGDASFNILGPRQALTAAPYASYAAQVGAHSHLGQTWSGSGSPLVIGGSFGSPGWAPLILSNSSGDGLKVTSTSNHGLSVDQAGWSGLAVYAADQDGVYVNSAGGSGLAVNWAAGFGVAVNSAGGHGMYVASASSEGVRVEQAGRYGMYVVSAADDGVRVDSAGTDGVYVASAANHGVYAHGGTDEATDYGGYFEGYNGVYGRGDSAGGVGIVGEGSTGVKGESENGIGVDGYAATGSGVVGAAFLGHGVRGTSVFGYGVSGESPARGVWGKATNSSGYGVYAENTAQGGVGLYAVGGQEGYAAIFQGTAQTQVLEITGGSDLAEPFQVTAAKAIVPGMLLAIDPDHPGQLRIAAMAYDRTVAGCVSGANGLNPGLTLEQEGLTDGGLPVALSGRVYCWADASYGSIRPGDLLTSSDTPGHAMKVSDHARAQGAIVGKAMSSLLKGRGLVLVLVALQ